MNKYEIPLEIKSYRFPEVDEQNMLKFNKPTYTAKNNIYFSSPNENSIVEDKIITGPRYIKISELPLNKKIKQPIIDIKHNSLKLPFLSPIELKQLISNANELLNKEGILYLSFVEGDPKKSGFKTASTGDRSYFFYHQLDEINKYLMNADLEIFKVFNVDYSISKNEAETHTIIISKKI